MLYSSQDARGEIDRKVVLDPNTLSEDGTIALSSYSFSEAGDLMAYSVSSGGSDWVTMHLLRIAEDGAVEKLADKLTNVKFTSMAWTHDGRGFFYNRYPAPEGLKGREYIADPRIFNAPAMQAAPHPVVIIPRPAHRADVPYEPRKLLPKCTLAPVAIAAPQGVCAHVVRVVSIAMARASSAARGVGARTRA